MNRKVIEKIHFPHIQVKLKQIVKTMNVSRKDGESSKYDEKCYLHRKLADACIKMRRGFSKKIAKY